MFEIGNIVYHIADELQEPRLVTGIVHRPHNVITYLVSQKDGETECYALELSSEKIVF
ncbi:hypothetical protein [Aquimarina macrocephali]|uniref:hypothetical protein n=1 Tax=Aquimarina macrocephali TaxID=666563 RepID=UPI003F664751